MSNRINPAREDFRRRKAGKLTPAAEIVTDTLRGVVSRSELRRSTIDSLLDVIRTARQERNFRAARLAVETLRMMKAPIL